MQKVESIARLLGAIVKFCVALSVERSNFDRKVSAKASIFLLKLVVPPIVRRLASEDLPILRLLSRSSVWEAIGSVLSSLLVEMVFHQGIRSSEVLKEEVIPRLGEAIIREDVKRTIKAYLDSISSASLS